MKKLCLLLLLLTLASPGLARPRDRLKDRREVHKTQAESPFWLALAAGQTGNFRQARQALGQCPEDALTRAVGALMDDAQGNYGRARKQFESLFAEPDFQAYQLQLHLGMVEIGRHSGDGRLVAAHLPQLVTAQTNAGPLTRFVCATLQREARLARMNPEELLREHDVVWKEFSDHRNLGSELIFPHRWTVEAARIWVLSMVRWYHRLGKDHPLAKQIEERLQQDLKGLLVFGTGLEALNNPELLSQIYFLALDLGRVGLELGEVDKVAELDRALDEFERTRLPNIKAKLERSLTPRFKSIGIDFSLEQGDLARLLSAHQRLKARLALARGVPGALEHLQRAATMLEKAPDLRGQVDLHTLAGQALLKLKPQGWVERGLEQADALQQLSQRSGSRLAAVEGQALRALVLAESDSTGALPELEKASQALEAMIAESGAADPEQLLNLGQRSQQLYAQMLRLYAEQKATASALATLSRQQDAQKVVGFAALAAPSDSQAVAAVEASRERTRALQEELEAQQALPAEQRDPEVAQKLASSRSEFYAAVRELRASEPDYAAALAIDPVDFAALQKVVPADTVLLEPYPGEDRLLLFAVTSETFEMYSVPVSGDALTSLVKQFRRAAAGAPPDFSWDSEAGKQLLAVLTQLGTHLLEPAQSLLQGKKRILYVPSGILHYFPLQAAAGLREGRPEFVVERFEVVNFTRTGDLMLGSNKTGSKRMLALGNPDGSLPSAENEARQVGDLFPGAEVLLQGAATEDGLLAVRAPGYLHLATHGVLVARDLNSSYLVLAGAGEKGRFRADEVLRMNLDDTDLVTLSACETAVGEWKPGGNVSSLAEAFGLAGCHSVAASLWRVSDDSTRDMMVGFYSQLAKGVGKGEALRQAQLSQLRGNYPHPYHWASFILIGDWK
ncbi:MAG: CHAT domain-containing protein [Vulcanimicrobiota bacterium]